METSTSGNETSAMSHTGNQISHEFIDTILKLSAENKFNEKNCWSFPIRDSLSFYEHRQENSMSSLIKAGSLAEACTKIYGFRVDSVYNNVKNTYLRLKDNDETQTETDMGDDITDLVGEEDEEAQKKKKQAKKERKRKSDFITKEKSSLLAPIQTHARGNLILDSKNKRSGEMNFVEGLLQNMLQTRDYVLQLDPAVKYWDSKADVQDQQQLPTSDNIDDNIEDFLDDVIAFAMPPMESLKASWICPSFRHFDVRLDTDGTRPDFHADTVEPAEKVLFDMDEPMMDLQVENRPNFGDRSRESMGGDASAGGFDNGDDHFAAADEPCNLGEHFNENNITDADVERYIEKNGGWSDVQPDQYGAVKRYMVRMAKNSRSTDGSQNNIKFTDFYESYWAGPAYWKFKKARASNTSTATTARAVGQKRTAKAKKVGGDREITMVDVNTLKFVPIEYKNRELDPRKVDAKNVIMPKNLNISRTIITNLTHTPWMSIYDIMGTAPPGAIETPPSMDGGGNSPGHYPEMNRDGEEFENGGGDLGDVGGGGWQNDDEDMGENEMEHEDHLNISHLSANLEGAPVKSEPIIIPFSKISKNIDMYELKQGSKKIIQKHTTEALQKGDAKMTLEELYQELPPELSKENAEYLSLAITFSALLHCAHEESFYLRSANNLETVEIL